MWYQHIIKERNIYKLQILLYETVFVICLIPKIRSKI